jgi:hypothetical protein
VTSRSVENYLKAAGRPRWMERVLEIDGRLAALHARLERAYDSLREEVGDDDVEFARRWRAYAERSRFDELNELIRRHNEWYPIERDLPMDPRTGDYVTFSGRSHRRPELSSRWVLERFPAERPTPR